MATVHLDSDQRLHPSDDDRRALINIAYRMLGSHAEASDAVGDGLTRWYAMPESRRVQIVSVRAWLITTVSRICLDSLKSARHRREAYLGVWLPEPMPSEPRSPSAPTDPIDQIALDESVSMALLVVLESLTPAERVVFILHDVFGYPYKDVGRIVGRSSDACRQLARSGRHRLQGHRQPKRADHAPRTVAALKQAWESMNLTAIVALLDPEASATTDGGGRVQAAVRPINGAGRVARALLRVAERFEGLQVETAEVNGEPGLVTRGAGGELLAVISLDVTDQGIRQLWITRNPDKLQRWSSHIAPA